MTRFLVIAVVVLFGVADEMVGDRPVAWIVDLDEPGALEALRRDNPSHYKKILEIMRHSSTNQGSGGPWFKKAENGAYNVSSGLLLTSNPPQKPLSFVLDGTHYRTLVTVGPSKANVILAK